MVIAALRQPLAVAIIGGAAIAIGTLFIAALTVTLASGIPTRPPFLEAAVAGALAAALAATGRRETLPWLALLHGLALLGITALQPFGVGWLGENAEGAAEGSGVVAQTAGLLLYAAVAAIVARDVLGKLPAAALNRHDFERRLIRLLRAFGFLFFGLIVAIPFLVMLLTAFKSQQALLQNPLDFSLPLDKGVAGLFRSYTELFTDYHFGTFLANTAVVSFATVIITLLFSVPGAYAVARLRFRGKQAMARSILLIYMVPAIVLVIPLYAVFSSLGIRNSHWGLLIAYPATTIPVALYMLQGYFRELPAELEEAGLIDGLSRWRVILHITLPLSLPALMSVSLYVFMIAWNEFLFAFMFLDDPQLFTLSRAVVSLNSSEVPRQHLMAGAVVSTLPVLVAFLWAERFLVRGLAAGGVKG